MTWQPGQRVISASDHTEWRTWKRTQKLEQQRQRRKRHPRIDYYPSPKVLEVINAYTGNFPGGDNSRVIDRLILSAFDELPE